MQTRDISRALPASPEAEQGVLGSMLISPRDVIGECVEKITEEFFYVPQHQTIYTVLVELWKAQQLIELITFTQVLRDRNILDAVGGASFVTSLFTFVPTAANLTYYLEIVREKYILRQMIAAGTEYVRRAYDEQDEVNELLNDFEKVSLSIRPEWKHAQQTSMKELVFGALEAVEKAYERKGAISGLSTGIHELDLMTDGLHPADLIVIAARPSMGKTALAMNIAEHVAIVLASPVGVFSLEMSKEQLVHRLLLSRARINMQRVRHGFLGENDFPKLTAAASKLADAAIYIDDSSGITIETIAIRARRMKQQHSIVLLIVDYLQLLKAHGYKPDHRTAEIGAISAGLKGIAKELRIPVIALAQLNRQPEARAGGKPRLSDLRESGNIEQDADVVGLLHRPEVYEDDPDARAEKSGEAELNIAKQRNGPIGEVLLTFLKEFCLFTDRARMN